MKGVLREGGAHAYDRCPSRASTADIEVMRFLRRERKLYIDGHDDLCTGVMSPHDLPVLLSQPLQPPLIPTDPAVGLCKSD